MNLADINQDGGLYQPIIIVIGTSHPLVLVSCPHSVRHRYSLIKLNVGSDDL
jgi:hypothetical protein